MPVKTLIDRLTDESNNWLNACGLEDIGNYADAAMLYLKDASESLKIGSFSRAGLSCSCAADCITRFKADAISKKLYFKSASIYMEIVKSSRHKSIRKWLWSLQKAYENFVLAGEASKADSILDEYVALAKRVQPSRLEVKSKSTKPITKNSSPRQSNMELPSKVTDALNLFLEQHGSN
ncbi:MAG: hypothetical protein KGI25_05055 [Thaumarchaeota archaeon]|nr:hypothetical protein [Nitrososphaerota archaeon]